MDLALLDFTHSATQRFLKWDVSRSNWARDYLGHIPSAERRALAKKFLNLFEEEAVPLFPRLRRSVIYGDANDHNALVDPQTGRVVSVIDFGDMHESFRVAEPAVAAAYAILGKQDVLAAAGTVLAGYHEVLPLKEEEIAVFFALMAARLAVSVVNSAHRKSLVQDDPYVTVSEAPAWAALEQLAQVSNESAREQKKWRQLSPATLRRCRSPKQLRGRSSRPWRPASGSWVAMSLCRTKSRSRLSGVTCSTSTTRMGAPT
jgi:Ser/Thr protein kinase RdoA (MazF antagonist)